ncbi:hypothetical protein BH11PLA2_BH11PLA2_30520 [soil metagenome]
MRTTLIAQTFLKRLPGVATARELAQMAQSPSYRAPRACDVLNPQPFVPPSAPRLCSQERRLLDAVITSPDDDAPRWDYAAWCDENGQSERAEFIGAQLTGDEIAPNPAWAVIYEPWAARDFVYRRGFVEAMSLSGRAFLSLGEPLFAMTPLREVRLVAIAPYLAELAACPFLKRLQVLNLRGNRITAAMAIALTGPQIQLDN